MKKSAFKSTPVNEVALGILPSLVPGLGDASNVLGNISGSLAQPDDNQKEGLLNLIPGVAAHRISNRLKTQTLEEYRKHKVDGSGQLISENLGAITPLALTAGLSAGAGAGIGKLLDKINNKKHMVGMTGGQKGAIIGAAVGGGTHIVSNIAAAIIAAVKRRRTEKEQIEHDKDRSNIAKNLLIPGVSTYNKAKRLGRSQGDRDEKKQTKKAELNKKAAKLGPFARYLELLLGNSKRLNVMRGSLNAYKPVFETTDLAEMAKRFKGKTRNYFDFATGNTEKELRRLFESAKSSGSLTDEQLRNYTKMLRQIGIGRNELGKVWATRGLTGLGLGGGAYGTYKAFSDDEPEYLKYLNYPAKNQIWG